ncbi:MAG: hypothetical protein FWH12_03395 [Treponema sp.]|nr:hypothetical protein [Treponema sp.]
MSKLRFFICIFCFAGLAGLLAQPVGVNSLKGMSLNGATGLFSIPTARVGWEQSSDFALDLGYHATFYRNQNAHIPKVSLSLFRWVEVHAAFDFQPLGGPNNNRGTDFIGGAKIQLPLTNTAIALGGNFQALHLERASDDRRYNAGQVYGAVTYRGLFFNLPAETTVVIGKTFREDYSNSDIDFGMGFDLLLLPDVLDGFIHWITDYANFSYSHKPFRADAWTRGVLNTGLRIDLSIIPVFHRNKFVIDLLMTDALDSTRAFSVGTVFGVSIR